MSIARIQADCIIKVMKTFKPFQCYLELCAIKPLKPRNYYLEQKNPPR